MAYQPSEQGIRVYGSMEAPCGDCAVASKIDFESASKSPSGFWWLDDKTIKELISLVSA